MCVQRFDDSLIQQFALHIEIRFGLHRYENQDIRCLKLFWFVVVVKLVQVGFGRWGLPAGAELPANHTALTHKRRERTLIREKFNPCGNDPSAGSPTETLLRLHLPLDDKV